MYVTKLLPQTHISAFTIMSYMQNYSSSLTYILDLMEEDDNVVPGERINLRASWLNEDDDDTLSTCDEEEQVL